MKGQPQNLQPFDMDCLNKIRRLRGKMKKDGKANSIFWDELEAILVSSSCIQNAKWERMEGEFVKGEIWRQTIGNFYHKNNVHHFTWMCIVSDGLVIDLHGHEERTASGTRRVKEWYVFPNGEMNLCKKGCKHSLANNYGRPIYVLSVKIGSKGMIKPTIG